MPYPISIDSNTDVEELVARKQIELRSLDYKAQLPGRSDSEILEFVADLSSFANAAGGFLLYGVTAGKDTSGNATGEPEAARGLKNTNIDEEKLRLESIAKDCTDRRIPNLRFEAILGFPDGPVLVVSIPRSWLAPHMVKRQKSTRFYSRNSAGRYQMDLTEIRAAILQSEGIEDRVRRFRQERVSKIRGGETLLDRVSGPRLVLHLVPLTLPDTAPIDISRLHERTIDLKPVSAGHGWDHRYSLDGFATFASATKVRSYIQVFRNGAVEIADDRILNQHPEGKPLVGGIALCVDLLRLIPRMLQFQRSVGVQPPIVVLLSLLSVNGVRVLALDPFMGSGVPIDRDDLLLPDVLLPALDDFEPVQMRAIFDALFQSAGWPRCPGYNEQGAWSPTGQ